MAPTHGPGCCAVGPAPGRSGREPAGRTGEGGRRGAPPEKLEFRLTYDTDIAKVKKIIKRIGQDLAADPELGPQLIQPLKSQGVLAMEDSAMLVKAKFTAKPGEQFLIRREAYHRIKQAFDEAGIRFAHRQVTVFVPPRPGLPTPAVAAAGGAAAAAATEPPAVSAP